MSDDAFPEEQQRLVSSRYAKVIISLCGFIILGLIATDRQQTDTHRMRQELANRRFHALEMERRLKDEMAGSNGYLLTLCHHFLGGEGEGNHTLDLMDLSDGQMEGKELMTYLLSGDLERAPVGFLGNWPQAHSKGAEDASRKWMNNGWNTLMPGYNKILGRFWRGCQSLTKNENNPKDGINSEAARNLIRDTCAQIRESLLLHAWLWKQKGATEDQIQATQRFIQKVLSQTNQPEMVTVHLAAAWKKGIKIPLDDETALAIARHTYAPVRDVMHSISESTRYLFTHRDFAPDQDEDRIKDFIQDLAMSSRPSLTGKKVGWVVTGEPRSLELDFESRDAPRMGLGYVEEPRAVSDLPVYSAYEFIDMEPQEALKLVKAYRLEVEKMLLTKATTESPVEIFGTGVNLRLTDLVLFAGPLIALFQGLYLIALGHEAKMKSVTTPKKGMPPMYPAFPRFSCPVDPLRGPRPATPEALTERVLYTLFLVLPPAILFLSWLMNFSLASFRGFLEQPFWSTGFSLAKISRGEDPAGFAGMLYICALGLSCYALHRTLIIGREGLPEVRWPRGTLIVMASLLTAVVAWVLAWRYGMDELYPAGFFILMAGGVVASIPSWRFRTMSVGRRVMFVIVPLFAFQLPHFIYSWITRSELSESAFYWFFPRDTNVLVPIWIISAGFFAALRRRQRLTTVFFSGALFMLLLALLQ